MSMTIRPVAIRILIAGWTSLGAAAAVTAQDAAPSPASANSLAVPPRNAATAGVTGVAPSDRPQDEQALKTVAQAYIQAYNAGNARALAAMFTDDAEMIDENGERIKGKQAIENVFAAMFRDRPGATLAITPASLRWISPDVAIEEGRTTVKVPGDDVPSHRHYTVAHVKQGNRWIYSSVREEQERSVPHHDRLQELAWLVGDWTDESPDSVVHVSCRWTEDGHFLLRDFTVRVQGKSVMTVSERIGWDPATRQIMSWVFDSEGGHGTGVWSRGTNDWVIKSTGVLSDGRIATATHILTRVGPQSARWASTERTVGDRVVPDHAEYLMVRQPPKPQGR